MISDMFQWDVHFVKSHDIKTILIFYSVILFDF